jgi:hypothetical protein
VGESFGRQGKIVGTGGQGRTINRSGGRTSYDGKRIAVGLDPFDLANALQNTGLISPASAASCHR